MLVISFLVPTRMYCASHYDAVLNIADNGIQLLD